VFDRLGLRCLAEKLDVRLIDLNHSAYVQVEVESGFVRVAEPCLQADYLINVPKIKTHAEAGMSVAVKNLMGCVVGADTRIMHLDLGANLVRLNQAVQPDLILVDGLIGMEGNGPGDGSPRRLDLLLAGRDPYELDLLVSRLMGLDAKESSYLKVAQQKGIIDDDVLRQMEDIDPMVTLEAPPQRSLVTRILEHHSLGRLRDLTRFIHGSEWARRLLYRFRIMQDVYETSEANVETLILEHELCDRCGLCLDVCPVELPITDKDFDFYASSDCLGCLYCAFICPQEAIQIVGELGYLEAHLARYGESMRSL
jgi:ferredoxin